VKTTSVFRDALVGLLAGTFVVEFLVLASLLYGEASVGDATVAIGTLALAAATVGLALVTFRLVQTTAEEMGLLRDQTRATTRQAQTAHEQLEHERDRFASQARTHVIWHELTYPPFSVRQLLGPTGDAGEVILVLEIVLKAKNISPVAASIDKVANSTKIHSASVNEHIVSPATTCEVVVWVLAKLFEHLEIEGAELELHYRSTISDETGVEKAALYIDGQITNEPRAGVNGRPLWFDGTCTAIPSSGSPSGSNQ